MHYILFYRYVSDYLEKREPYRSEHIAGLKKAYEDGLVVMAGALNDPPDSAAIIFRTDDPAVVKEMAVRDPYVQNGIVAAWDVRPWTVVVGADQA